MRSSFLAVLLLCAAACGPDPEPIPPHGELVTRHEPVAPGDDCPAGGTRVHVGHDDDGDGQLGDDEIEETELLCDGEPPSTVLSTEPIEPGEQCPAGGTAVHTGVDDDGDGVLDADEIDRTSVLCGDGEIFAGDFTRADWDDPARVAALQAARVVTGSVAIASDEPVDLHGLELIGGDLSVDGDLPALDISGLREVLGSVGLDAPGIDDLTLPALERVGGALNVDGNGGRVVAPALTAVAGRVQFWRGSQGDVVMPALVTIGGDLILEGSLTALDLDALAEVGGNLVYADRTLPAIELPALRAIDGSLHAAFAERLTRIDLPALVLLGELVLTECDGLVEIELPALQRVARGVAIHAAPALTTLDLGTVISIGDSLIVDDAPALTTLLAPALISLKEDPADTVDDRGLLISGTGLTTLSLPLLRPTDVSIEVIGNAALTTISLDRLGWTSRFSVYENPNVTTIRAPELIKADVLHIGEAAALTALELGALRDASWVVLRDLALTDLSGLSSLQWSEHIHLDNLDHLVDLAGLDGVQIASNIEIQGCAALTSLTGLDHLEQISNELRIQHNPSLTSLTGLGGLTQVWRSVVIDANDALTGVDGLEHLRAINGSLTITANPALTNLDGLAALTYVGDQVAITDNDALATSELVELQAQLGD